MNTYFLAISRMEVRLSANATESFTTERKRNETECKRNETECKRNGFVAFATRRNKTTATRTFNANGNGVGRKRNGNFTWAFIDLVSFK